MTIILFNWTLQNTESNATDIVGCNVTVTKIRKDGDSSLPMLKSRISIKNENNTLKSLD